MYNISVIQASIWRSVPSHTSAEIFAFTYQKQKVLV